ncbi:serpin-ZX [Tanacetum coccineum]
MPPLLVITKAILDDACNGFKNGNFVCSPFSLDILLELIAPGVEGNTLKQLLRFLGHESIDQLLSESPSSKLFAEILSNPKIGEGGLDLSIANGVWVDKKLKPLQSSYQEVLKSAYNTKGKYIDFENKRDRSAGKINSWVKKKTKGLIPSIVAAGDLKDVFIDGHCKCLVYKMIKLPYKSEGKLNLSMYIFLPHKRDGLQNLLQLFHSDDALFHGDFDLRHEEFDELWIPKFKISCKFEPKDVMKQMGLTLPFEPANKEFSGIVEPRCDYYKNLYVSKILQQSFIEVDEKGTVAAAVTAMFMYGYGGCPLPKPKPSFVADHPFMFMIREDTSKAALCSILLITSCVS